MTRVYCLYKNKYKIVETYAAGISVNLNVFFKEIDSNSLLLLKKLNVSGVTTNLWIGRNVSILGDINVWGTIRIGNNTVIGEGVTMLDRVRIGSNVVIMESCLLLFACNIRNKVTLEKNVSIGKHSIINPYCVLGKNSVIGQNSILRSGDKTSVTTSNHTVYYDEYIRKNHVIREREGQVDSDNVTAF